MSEPQCLGLWGFFFERHFVGGLSSELSIVRTVWGEVDEGWRRGGLNGLDCDAAADVAHDAQRLVGVSFKIVAANEKVLGAP
jgi:hypothetical protein